MNVLCDCDGKIEVYFSYSETGEKDDLRIVDEDAMIAMFVNEIRGTLEDAGLTIDDIEMDEFNYSFTDIQKDREER